MPEQLCENVYVSGMQVSQRIEEAPDGDAHTGGNFHTMSKY